MLHKDNGTKLTLSLEQKLAVLSSVLFVVINVDCLKATADGAGGFVGSQDALASSGNSSSVLNKFSGKRT
jgi:hypothetical protein